jgi:methionyl-tRNA formyltransferase
MRIVFVGTVIFSKHMLNELIQANADVVGVVISDKNSFNSDYADLQPICNEKDIPCHSTTNINSLETLAWISSYNPDIIFCFGWSQLIKSELLNLPPNGVVGYHPAALPKNRGHHPLIWALVLGLTETASTFFFMDKGADSGDILSQEIILISGDDDATSLYSKIIDKATKQILLLVQTLEKGSIKALSQDHSDANIWRKRSQRDGTIDWRMSAESVYNLIRGLTHPYVGAEFIYHRVQSIKVWKSRVVVHDGIENLEPGKVAFLNDSRPIIKCGIDCIELLEFEPPIDLKIGEYL